HGGRELVRGAGEEDREGPAHRRPVRLVDRPRRDVALPPLGRPFRPAHGRPLGRRRLRGRLRGPGWPPGRIRRPRRAGHAGQPMGPHRSVLLRGRAGPLIRQIPPHGVHASFTPRAQHRWKEERDRRKEDEMRRWTAVLALVLVILAGVAIGVGAYHAGYNHGLEASGRVTEVVREVGPGGFGFGFILFPLFFFL